MINQKRMLDEFCELVQITCSSGKERKMVDLMKPRLEKLGLEVTEDQAGEKLGGNAGNVLAYLKGNVSGAPVIMMSAHLDCVEPCSGVKPQIKDGIITSAGDTILGSDDKAGVAAILEALRIISENKIPHGDVQIVLTVQEESGLCGAKNIDRAWIKADFGYAFDSSGEPGKIIIKAPGENTLKVTIKGKTAHAGLAPEEGINAIVVGGKALAELKQGRIDEETTANVGIIKGGQATNVVPDRLEIVCEARSHNMDKLKHVTQEMKETFERVAAANGAQAEVEVVEDFVAYALKEDSKQVALAVQAATSIGLTAKLEATGGGSDANVFNCYGIPTAVLGMGMSKVHTTEEFIKEEDLYQGAELAVALIKTAAEGS
ncbi:Peptidase T [bioreactor metagenome]|uniref:Peptidase T n=1 Tax=bioreactor metagenome TaxID=1076179 RepID=A0A644TS62_9ZZZZ|nr:M20/M25/M40 family metallo-hydrolase [Negativicutes bacterium]